MCKRKRQFPPNVSVKMKRWKNQNQSAAVHRIDYCKFIFIKIGLCSYDSFKINHVSTIQFWFPELPNSVIVKSILTVYMFPILMLYLDFAQKDSQHFSHKDIFSSIKPNMGALDQSITENNARLSC